MMTLSVDDVAKLDQPFRQFLMKTGMTQPLISDAGRPQRMSRLSTLQVSDALPERFVDFTQRIDVLMASSKRPEGLGLAMADKVLCQERTLLSLMAMTAPTLGDALQVLSRYHLLSQGLLPEPPSRQLESGRVVLRLPAMPVRGLADRLVTDAMIALWVAAIRQVSPRQSIVETIHVQYARHDVDHDRLLRTALKAPVQYQSTQNAVVLIPGALQLAMPEAAPALHQQLRLLADFLVSHLDQEQTLAMQVNDWLLRNMRGRAPSLEQCADALGMTSWTLRRRLTDEGSSFNRILESLRKSLALTHIEEGRLSNGEISYLLGFSNTGVFQRAFKRWTGSTPGELRRLPR